MIFQEPLTRLNPLMRISEHFEETIKQHEPGLAKDQVKARALEVLRLMGIPPTRYRSYPHEFSGGMRQRLMIALALVLRPAFVVADEPTTALDVLVEAQIIQILNDLRRNFKTSLLLITHNLGIVAEACDRVAVMYAGRIVEQGRVRRRVREPAAPLHARAAALDHLAADDRPQLHPGRASGPGRPAGRMPLPPALSRARWRCAPPRTRSTSSDRAAAGSSAGWPARGTRSRAGGTAAARAGGAGRCRRSLRRRPGRPPGPTHHRHPRPLRALRPERRHARPAVRQRHRHGQGRRRHQPGAAARRGRRTGRRERQRQVHPGPGAARAGPGDRRGRSRSRVRTSRS